MRRQLLIVALVVLALRLPFLNQALQGDDILYLTEAEHAQIDPLHPKHTTYVFMGRDIDMRGQSHPPLDAWFLALLIAATKDVSEIPFHAAYILFSSDRRLQRARARAPVQPAPAARYSAVSCDARLRHQRNFARIGRPIRRALADVHGSVRHRSRSRVEAPASGFLLRDGIGRAHRLSIHPARSRSCSYTAENGEPRAPPLSRHLAILVAWQIFERLSTGALPAGLLANYLTTYGFEALAQKLKSAVALTGHLAWIVFPTLSIPPLLAIPFAIGAAFYDLDPLFWASIAIGVGILIRCAQRWRDFLAQWVLIFFAGALVIFFAGSARYLLPIALPIAILATQRAGVRLLQVSLACGFALSLTLAAVNYQHWDGYREFARALASDAQSKRIWINGEWGLRYYLESEGGLPLRQGQAIHPDEIVASSKLSYPIAFTTGGGILAPIAQRTITSAIPLRLVALEGRAAYSTTMLGLRPFDISLAPMDQLTRRAHDRTQTHPYRSTHERTRSPAANRHRRLSAGRRPVALDEPRRHDSPEAAS